MPEKRADGLSGRHVLREAPERRPRSSNYRAALSSASPPTARQRVAYPRPLAVRCDAVSTHKAFVRLFDRSLEEAGADYVDVARRPEAEGGGVAALMKMLRAPGLPPFAPPLLRAGSLVIAQTTNILLYLGPRHRLVPESEGDRLHANQLQLSVADLVAEVHETHHPIASGLYYADQKPEARRRSEHFTRERIPKFLSYFERVLEGGSNPYVFGDDVSYVDLSLFQVLEGLRYAFPVAMAHVAPGVPRLIALGERVRGRPRIAAYLASPRRLAFNEDGIFRRYPELDAVAAAR